MLLGDEGQREEHDRPRACDAGTNEVEGCYGRKRNTTGLNAGLRSKQGQVEPKGVIGPPTCGLCRNGDSGAPTQEVLLKYRLSFE